MRKISILLAATLLAGSAFVQAAPAATVDGPSAGGLSSDNVEWLAHIPLSIDGVGGRVVGRYFYTNDQNKIMIFDLEDPVNPEMVGVLPMPQEWLYSREDIDTNGKIMIVPNTVTASADGQVTPGLNAAYVIDVEDKTNPTIIGKAVGGAQHTLSCILDCKWAYGSDGMILDLRKPTEPKVMKQQWGTGLPATGGHDVEEIAPGYVLTATQPIMLLDVHNPIKPKLLAMGRNEDGRFIHTGRWTSLNDKFLLMAGETNNRVRCNETAAAFMTWDASKWRKTHTFSMIDEYRMTNGTYVDGSPAVNQVGCSSHWHEAHPTFKNGGIVAAAFFEHGTRFIDVSNTGKIKEVGWFMPAAGSTGAVYWVTDEIVYAVDYNRGIDILRWNGGK